MFDPNVTSITCGSLDFFESAVDFNDLAFLNLIMCMQESDKALSAKMKEIRQLNELKRQITADIDYLNKYLARSDTKFDDKDGYLYVGDLDDPQDPDRGRFPSKEAQQEYEKAWTKNFKEGYDVDENGNVVPPNPDMEHLNGFMRAGDMITGKPVIEPLNRKATADEMNRAGLYKRSEVEAKIEELRGRLEDLNSSSSVMMIDLQRLMNKRNEATQLVSNIEAKSHQTAQAILANIK
jgi:hypothetical protein